MSMAKNRQNKTKNHGDQEMEGEVFFPQCQVIKTTVFVNLNFSLKSFDKMVDVLNVRPYPSHARGEKRESIERFLGSVHTSGKCYEYIPKAERLLQ